MDGRKWSVPDVGRPRLVLVAFCLLAWLPGLFTIPPTDRDESRFAQASKQMIETGDYVRIMNGTEPRNRKPIGIHWLQVPFAGAARVLGIAVANPVWPYRVPSLLGGMLAVLGTFEIGLAAGGRRVGLAAGGMLAASVLLVAETHLAKTDAALLGLTVVAMAVLSRAYAGRALGRPEAAVFWLALGVGILLKGPILPMVAGLAVVSLAVADRRAGWLRALRPASGVLVMAAVVLPWFVAIGVATHGTFFGDAVGGDLGRKLAGGDDAHGAPPGVHLALLPLLAFPAALPVLRSMPGWWPARRDAACRFLLAWAVPSWIVFEAVPTKLPHYTLPLYPALFLLTALRWDSVRPTWWARWGAPGVALAGAGVLAAGAGALPPVVGAAWQLGVPAVLAVMLVGAAAMVPARPLLAVAAMPLVSMALLGFELPQTRPLWLAPRLEAALVAAGLGGKPLEAVGFHEPSLVFIAGTGTLLAPTGTEGARLLASGQAEVAAVAAPDVASFDAEAARLGMPLQAVGRVAGFNYSRGRRTELSLLRRAGPLTVATERLVRPAAE